MEIINKVEIEPKILISEKVSKSQKGVIKIKHHNVTLYSATHLTMTYENTILWHSYIFPSGQLAILLLPAGLAKHQKKTSCVSTSQIN